MLIWSGFLDYLLLFSKVILNNSERVWEWEEEETSHSTNGVCFISELNIARRLPGITIQILTKSLSVAFIKLVVVTKIDCVIYLLCCIVSPSFHHCHTVWMWHTIHPFLCFPQVSSIFELWKVLISTHSHTRSFWSKHLFAQPKWLIRRKVSRCIRSSWWAVEGWASRLSPSSLCTKR